MAVRDMFIMLASNACCRDIVSKLLSVIQTYIHCVQKKNIHSCFRLYLRGNVWIYTKFPENVCEESSIQST